MGTKQSGVGAKFLPFGSARWALAQASRGEDAHPNERGAFVLEEAAHRLARSLDESRPESGESSEGLSHEASEAGLSADATDVLGLSWEIARLGEDSRTRCALLFLVAAISVSETLGGSCLELPRDGDDPLGREKFSRVLLGLGATSAEVEAALELTDLPEASEVAPRCRECCAVGFVPEGAFTSLDAILDRRCPILVQSVGDRRFAFLERSLCLELALAKNVARRLTSMEAQTENQGKPDLSQVRPQNVSTLANREQLRAVNAVLTALREAQDAPQTGPLTQGKPGKLLIITGGPGTGKTFTVAQILRAIAADEDLKRLIQDNAIRFTAPTGKAADRMEESIRKSLGGSSADGADGQKLLNWLAQEDIRPKTIHRLLGWNPLTGKTAFHRRHPLNARLIISDEASMIGLELMDRLVTSVRSDAVFVLLGDENQLPSVEAGAVLRELCALNDVTDQILRLVQSKRQSSDPGGMAIGAASQAIHEGRLPPPEVMAQGSSVESVLFDGMELVSQEGGRLQKLCDKWFEKFTESPSCDQPSHLDLCRQVFDASSGAFSPPESASLKAIFQAALSQKVLTLTRAQKDALNQAFHLRQVAALRSLLQSHSASHPGRFHRDSSGPFSLGEPVMMLRNDSKRGVFNGDQGVVLRVKTDANRPHRLHVVFQKSQGFAFFPLNELLDDLDHAFAMTIHKSQGSEYERVLLVLPQDSHSPLLCRELIYTAVTRAKKSAVICGNATVLQCALEKTASERRMSSLSHRLRRLMNPPLES